MAGTPREQLSTDDAAILALESSAIAGHTLKLLLLEAGPEPLDVDRLRAEIAGRLAAEPRAIERIEVEAGSPAWVVDGCFDITAHVRERERTAGIDEAGLWSAAGELMAEHLDHSRPLWSIDLVGPLADGREAIVVRIHHAMADGVSCVRFLERVLWESEARATAPRPRKPEPARPSASPVDELRRLPGALLRELGGHAPSTLLDRAIGAGRSLAFASAPLETLKRIGAARPGHVTVNDVLLAGIAGGLRRWLAAAGSAQAGMRAQVPVSLHHRDEGSAELGNRDSFLNVDLPLAEEDPLARLDRINAETTTRKRLGDAEELYDFFHALSRFDRTHHLVERIAGSPHEFSLSISNVPGPRAPVSVIGRRVERLYTVAEPAERHALRVSAISCAGTVGVGLCTDPAAVGGVEDLARAVEASFAELEAASGAAIPPGRRG